MLELNRVFDTPGLELDINEDIDFSDYELYGSYPFITPVSVTGKIKNTAGVVNLSYNAKFAMNLTCDRCLKDFKRNFDFNFSETLVTYESTDNDDYITVVDCKLDLKELCLSDIFLSLPSKLLCSEDCKGLCAKCGANLNETKCLCNNKETDPRLAVLSKLFEE